MRGLCHQILEDVIFKVQTIDNTTEKFLDEYSIPFLPVCMELSFDSLDNSFIQNIVKDFGFVLEC